MTSGVPKFVIAIIEDLSIAARKIAPNAVITSKIVDKAVTIAKLADEVIALFGGGDPVTLVQVQAGGATSNSQTWALTWSGPITIPEDGDWIAIFESEVSILSTATVSERQLEIGISLDGADPLTDDRRKVTPPGGSAELLHASVFAEFQGLTAGQTIGSMIRKANAGTVSASASRRTLRIQKVDLTIAP